MKHKSHMWQVLKVATYAVVSGTHAYTGPTSELIKQLFWKDVLLRSLPPVIQSMVLLGAV